MKEAPLVTVYITNYNYGSYIKEAIESVLNQSFKDIELIIIDDGSSDNSREIIESYMQLNYVRVIFQKNKGLNITNNIAMSNELCFILFELSFFKFIKVSLITTKS